MMTPIIGVIKGMNQDEEGGEQHRLRNGCRHDDNAVNLTVALEMFIVPKWIFLREVLHLHDFHPGMIIQGSTKWPSSGMALECMYQKIVCSKERFARSSQVQDIDLRVLIFSSNSRLWYYTYTGNSV